MALKSSIVFNEFEMPCMKHETDNSTQSEMKLTRFSFTQPEIGEIEPVVSLIEGN